MLKSRQFYYDFFVEKRNSGIKPIESSIGRLFPELINEVSEFMQKHYPNHLGKYSEKLYLYLHNRLEIPKCEFCNHNLVKFKQLSFGYFEFCSVKCSSNSEKKKKMIEQTCLEKYGHRNVAHGEGVKQKIQEAYQEKFGGHPSQNAEIQEKKQKTFIDRFGGHPFQNEIVKDKIKTKIIEKYGVDNPLQNKIIAKKMYETKKKLGLYCKWNEAQIKDYEEYREIVRHYTEQTFRTHYYEINPEGLIRDRYAYHLDHIYPIIEGWKNNVPAILIASKHNLQMLWWKENHGKCDYTKMTVEEFYLLVKEKAFNV